MADLWLTGGELNRAYAPDFADCVLPSCKFLHGEFLRDMRGRSAAEIGIHTALLMKMLSGGEAISMPATQMARLCGTGPSKLRSAIVSLLEDRLFVQLDVGL